MLKIVPTRNDKESFKTFLEPDGNPERHQNESSCSLSHCQQLLTIALKFADKRVIFFKNKHQLQQKVIKTTKLTTANYYSKGSANYESFVTRRRGLFVSCLNSCHAPNLCCYVNTVCPHLHQTTKDCSQQIKRRQTRLTLALKHTGA